MYTVQLDHAVTDFTLPSTSGSPFRLSEQQGKHIAIYFYPKDSTPGCTLEGKDFNDRISQFTRQNTIVVGVSRDSIRAHENFKRKQGFAFELLSDSNEIACRLFDVIKLKKNYGREYLGIVRSTFLLDEAGILRREWRNVKIKGHAEDVLTAAQSL